MSKGREIAHALGIQLGLIVAGFSGGVVSTLFATNLTRAQALSSILASLLTSSYLTPVEIQYFNITSDPYKFGAAFLTGLFTMSLIPAIKLIGAKYIAVRVQGLASDKSPSDGSPDS